MPVTRKGMLGGVCVSQLVIVCLPRRSRKSSILMLLSQFPLTIFKNTTKECCCPQYNTTKECCCPHLNWAFSSSVKFLWNSLHKHSQRHVIQGILNPVRMMMNNHQGKIFVLFYHFLVFVCILRKVVVLCNGDLFQLRWAKGYC